MRNPSGFNSENRLDNDWLLLSSDGVQLASLSACLNSEPSFQAEGEALFDFHIVNCKLKHDVDQFVA